MGLLKENLVGFRRDFAGLNNAPLDSFGPHEFPVEVGRPAGFKKPVGRSAENPVFWGENPVFWDGSRVFLAMEIFRSEKLVF